MAATFAQLALLRIGVGLGEAGGTPPSHALIADYFPPEQRSTALGIHGTATQFGVLIGMIGGAVIAEHLGWRAAFVIFGLPAVGALISAVLQMLFILWPQSHAWQVGEFTVPVAMLFMLVGAASDVLLPTFAEQSIRYALLASLLSVVAGGILYWRSAEAYARELGRA